MIVNIIIDIRDLYLEQNLYVWKNFQLWCIPYIIVSLNIKFTSKFELDWFIKQLA